MKYFYLDPLAAAWMADKFGMAFDDGRLNDCAERKGWEEFFGVAFFNSQKFYIHPDSLPILEPKNGDLVAHYDFSGSWKNPYYLETAAFDKFKLNVSKYFLNNSGMILQRNDIAFHWPAKIQS